MRILYPGERKGQCPKCKTIFAYTEEDIDTEFNPDYVRLCVLEKKYIKCPQCKAKLLEDTKIVE